MVALRAQNRHAPAVAIGGGKGGVGKSIVSANLAIAIARLGMRVTLVDADLGAANLHTLFGIERPGLTVQGLIDRAVDNLEEVVVATDVPRLFLVAGANATPGAANIAHAQKLRLLRHIQQLDTDFVVVDCGAGTNFNALDFFNLADHRVVVLTPQLTSLQNGYGFLKGALYRAITTSAKAHGILDVVERSRQAGELERIDQLLETLAVEDALAANIARAQVEAFSAHLVANLVDDPSRAPVFHAFSRMIRDFLGLHAPLRLTLRVSAAIHESVNARRPYLCDHPTSPEGRAFSAFAERLLECDLDALRARRHAGGSRPEVPGSAPPPVSLDEHMLPGPLDKYGRQSERIAVDWPATVRVDGQSFAVRILDVSAHGAGLETDSAPLRIGSRLELRIERDGSRFAVEGDVRHVSGEGTRFGVEFIGAQFPAAGARLVEAARR